MADDNAVIVSEIRNRNAAELKSLLASKVEELHQVKFKHALQQLQETHQLKALKRDISRLKTILREKGE